MFFNIIFFIYSIVYLPYLIFTKRWYKDFECRFGLFPLKIKGQLSKCCTVWIHAVSVGEVMAIVRIIDQIKSKWPSQKIVLTTTTKTGYELACHKFGSSVVVIPSPLDFTWVVQAFVRLIKPKIYIATETEIWPNLYACLKKNNVPIMVINGRISDISFRRYKLIRGLLKTILAKVWLFCMQSEIDATRIKELGAPEDKVLVLGNVKFDDLPTQNRPSPYFDLQRPLWIAGSTHPGEEEIVLETFKEYKDAWALVIAPRHVERSDEIVSLIRSKGLKPLRFSEMSKYSVDANTVIVLDTIGHLKEAYAQASLVFVGKSLCGGGGQNIIEPAFYAKAMIIGPFMENFRDITALFKSQDALVQVKDAIEFKDQVHLLMKDERLRKDLGERAFAVVKENQGASQRILERLSVWL